MIRFNNWRFLSLTFLGVALFWAAGPVSTAAWNEADAPHEIARLEGGDADETGPP